ncbi:MAG: hypothetical protein QM485_14910 [Flavobacteriaceae bacterium]
MKELYKESNSQVSIPDVIPMKMPKPIYWKQVLITTLSVYPLLIGSTWFLKQIFPMEELAQEAAIFFTVAMVASLMVFPVMPLIMKFLGSWPYKK